MIKLIILGSGTGVPSLERSSPGYYLQTSSTECLVDCGSGTIHQLERTGRSYKSIDAIFFTHTHPDHIGDLIPFIHALKVTPGFRREKPLRLFGPSEFTVFFEKYVAPVVRLPKHFEIEVTEVTTAFDFMDIKCSPCPTVHSDYLNSIAFRFEKGTQSMVLSGDCDVDDGITALSQDADLLVIDCSFPDAFKVQGHLSATECGNIAAQARVKHLILTHLYPVEDKHDTRLEEANAVFSGKVELADDLKEIELTVTSINSRN